MYNEKILYFSTITFFYTPAIERLKRHRHQVVSRLLHHDTCYNLFKTTCSKQLVVISLSKHTRFDNQLETNVLTTCKRLVVNMQTHPDIASLYQVVARRVTCIFFAN